MTDDSREPGRIDLRALDEPADPTRAERVVGAALARAALGGSVAGAASESPARPVAALFGAAALLLLATGLLLFAPRRPSPQSATSLIAAWTMSGHVPTNAELLGAFGGYAR
jgi:hypothetical protein